MLNVPSSKPSNTDFICPLCKLPTPQIHSLYIDEKTKTPFLSLLCKCSPKSIEISLSKCLVPRKEKQNCFKHETEDAFVFCRKCSLYMCETCYNYHSLFKTNHSEDIEIASEKKEESTNCDTVNTFLSKGNLNFKSFSLFECGYSKLISEYNDFVSSENKIIDSMIYNLNQLKKDIHLKKEIVLHNSKQTFDFIKSLHSIKAKNHLQKLSPIDSIVLKQDHDMISKICVNFNKMIQIMLKTQCQIVSRPIVAVDGKDERQFSTTVGLTEPNDLPPIESVDMNSEIKNHISTNYIDIIPTISPVIDNEEQINLFSQNSSLNESDSNTNINESEFMQKTYSKINVLTQDESIYALTEHANAISCMIQILNNKNENINHQIVTASNEAYIIFWNATNFQAMNRMNSRKGNISIVNELSDGSLALAYDNNIIKIYIIPEQICTSILIGHSNGITSMIQPAPSVLASSSRDATIKLWDLTEKTCCDSICEHTKSVNCLLYLNEGKFASCSDDSRILIIVNKKIVFNLEGHSGRVFKLCKVASMLIASCGDDLDVKLWDYTNGTCVGSLIKHDAAINDIISLSSTTPFILSVSNDKSLIVWNVEKRSMVKKLESAHSQGITTALLTKDGKVLTGGSDGLIKIWI